MDLSLYGRVLWRWRMLLAAGLVAAVGLAILSVYTPTLRDGRPQLTRRVSEQWRSDSVVYLTYPGFPGGRTSLTPNPLQFNAIAALYAKLANSDAVRRRIIRADSPDGTYSAIPTADTTYGQLTPLPMVTFLGDAPTPEQAKEVTRRATLGFLSYVRGQQRAAGIPERQRVALEVINAPSNAINIKPRKKTLPIVVFLTVLVAAIGFAFVLENLKPGLRLAPSEQVQPAQARDKPEVTPEERPDTAVRRWA